MGSSHTIYKKLFTSDEGTLFVTELGVFGIIIFHVDTFFFSMVHYYIQCTLFCSCEFQFFADLNVGASTKWGEIVADDW